MNQRYPWLKLHRRMLDHPWLTQRSEWFAAWVQILILTEHDTGSVELGEIPARAEMTEMAWRHFLKKLEKEGMICNVRTENLGRGGGMKKLAQIANWEQYQASPEERRLEQRLEQRKEQRSKPSGTVESTGEERRLEQGLPRRLEQSLSILDKDVEKKEERVKPNTSRGDDARIYQTFKDTWQKLKPEKAPILKDNREVAARIRADVKRLGEEEFFRRVEAALRFVAKDHFHTEQRPCPPMTLLRHLDSYSELSGPSEVEKKLIQLPIGTPVKHPVHGVDEIRYYRQDGQIVLDHCGALVKPSEVTPCLN